MTDGMIEKTAGSGTGGCGGGGDGGLSPASPSREAEPVAPASAPARAPGKAKHDIWNLPNLLTMLRFPASPLILWLILQWDTVAHATPEGTEPRYQVWVAIGIAVTCMVVFLSDLFDGKVARKYNIVSDFGKIMDPIADSTFFVTLLVAYTVSERLHIPVWFPMLVFYREVAIQAMRRIAAARGVVLAAGWSGKAKMVIQSVAMAVFGVAMLLQDFRLVSLGEGTVRAVCFWTSLLVVVVNLLSLAEYLLHFPQYMKAALLKASPSASLSASAVTVPPAVTGTTGVPPAGTSSAGTCSASTSSAGESSTGTCSAGESSTGTLSASALSPNTPGTGSAPAPSPPTGADHA